MPLPFILIGIAAAAGLAVAAGVESECDSRDEVNEDILKLKKLKKKLKKAKSRNPQNLLNPHQEEVHKKYIATDEEKYGFKTDDGKFQIAAHKIQNPGHRDWETSKDQIDRLSPFISALPLAGIVGHISSNNYMIVEASGQLMSAQGGGFRGTIQGLGGKISGHAKLHPSQLGSVATPAVIWAAISFIVGQKHLHDISQKLEKISKGIDRISDFQQNHRLSEIYGDYHYLVELIEDLKTSPEKLEKKYNVIEDVYRKTFSIQHHLVTDIKNIFIDSEDIDSASESMIELEGLASQLLLCMRIKIQCFMLQEMISPNSSTVKKRLNELREKIKMIPSLIYDKFDSFFEGEASAWGDLEQFKLTILSLKLKHSKLSHSIETFHEFFEDSFDMISVDYKDLSNVCDSLNEESQRILVKLKGEKIVGISRHI